MNRFGAGAFTREPERDEHDASGGCSNVGAHGGAAKVVVEFVPQGGTAKRLVQVTDPSKCAPIAEAWHFTSSLALGPVVRRAVGPSGLGARLEFDDPAKPSRVVFCDATCGALGDSSTGKVVIAAATRRLRAEARHRGRALGASRTACAGAVRD